MLIKQCTYRGGRDHYRERERSRDKYLDSRDEDRRGRWGDGPTDSGRDRDRVSARDRHSRDDRAHRGHDGHQERSPRRHRYAEQFHP